jgi:uncharacterized membrane protein
MESEPMVIGRRWHRSKCGGAGRKATPMCRTGAIVFLVLPGGIAHFCATATEMRIVPPWCRGSREAVLVSWRVRAPAAGLLAADAPRRRRRPVALTLAVTPAHLRCSGLTCRCRN